MGYGLVDDCGSVLPRKLEIPLPPSPYVERPGLIEKVRKICAQRLTWVVAPMGCGKTCLAAELALSLLCEEGARVFWLTLDEQDNDGERFWGHFLAAMGGSPANCMDDIHAGEGPEALAARLASNHVAGETFYFLDGFDAIHNACVEQRLMGFLERVPQRVHVVITSRWVSDWLQLSSLKLGQIRIGWDLLTLDESDVRALAEGSFDSDSHEDVEKRVYEVRKITEGWPQGVYLALIEGEACARRGVPLRFDHSTPSLRRYFAANAAFLSEEERGALLKLSLLERFSYDLCAFLFVDSQAGDGFGRILDGRQLLVGECDGDVVWYRFTDLFAGWLRSEAVHLPEATLRGFCLKAGEWFQGHNFGDEAVKYLLMASDFEYIEGIVEATSMLRSECAAGGHLTKFCSISSRAFPSSPFMSLAAAWAYNAAGDVSRSLQWVDVYEACAKDPANAHLVDPEAIEFSLEFIRLKADVMMGGGDDAYNRWSGMVENGSISQSLMSTVYQSLGEACDQLGKTAEAEEAYLHAQASASVDRTRHQLYFNMFNYAMVRYRIGDLDGAREMCEKLLGSCPTDYSFVSAASALQAKIHVERNELDLASDCLEKALLGATPYRNFDLYLIVKIAECLYLVAKGEQPAAFEAISSAVMRGDSIEVPCSRMCVAYFVQAEIASQRKTTHNLIVIEKKFERQVKRGDVYSELMLSYVRALVAQARGELEKAGVIFEGVADRAKEAGYVRIELKALVSLVGILKGSGETAGVNAAMGKILKISKKHGFVRTLLDAEESFRRALVDYSSSISPGSSVRTHAKALLVEFKKEGKVALGEEGLSPDAHKAVDSLTPREREVLELLNIGMSRKEISEALVISQNTTKRHISNIYGKLGVRRRKQALEKAYRCDGDA